MKKQPFMNSKNRIEVNNLLKELNSNIKNKNSLNKCEQFCKQDYIPYIEKKFTNMLKKHKLPSLKKRSAQYETDKYTLKYSQCKKQFCNPECVGYTFMGNKKKQNNFRKSLKNGFINKYDNKKVETLKKRGALSGCVYVTDYNR